MSALTRFERLDDLFPEMFRRFMQPMTFSGEHMRDIRIDVTENDKDYVVRAEIPGGMMAFCAVKSWKPPPVM